MKWKEQRLIGRIPLSHTSNFGGSGDTSALQNFPSERPLKPFALMVEKVSSLDSTHFREQEPRRRVFMSR